MIPESSLLVWRGRQATELLALVVKAQRYLDEGNEERAVELLQEAQERLERLQQQKQDS
ncbi:MAG: hypothetical protein ACE5JN_15615 [Candidatus Methylomirabilia bacterium]